MAMKNNNQKLILTIIISGAGAFVGYLINFLVTPYVTETLGVEAYGFVSIANSVVNYAGIITIAFTSFIVRYISVSYHEKKIQESNVYYSSSIIACNITIMAILFIAMHLIAFLEHLLKIPVELVASVKVLFVIVFINFAVVTVSTPFSAAAYVANRLDIVGIVKTISKILEALILIILFKLLDPEVWFVPIGALIASVIVLLSNVVLTRKLTPELSFRRAFVKVQRIKDLVFNGIWNSFNQLGNVLNSGLDLLISNLMLTGTETGEVAVAKTIGTIFAVLFQTISQPFQPLLIKAYASGSLNTFEREVSKAMRLCGLFGSVAFAGFVGLGECYFKLWLPSQNSTFLYYLTVITVFNYITDSILQPVYYINTLTIKNKIPCIVTIAGGLLNILAMFLLLTFTSLRAYAVVLTTAVIMVTINITFNPLYAAKTTGIKSRFFYRILLKHLMTTVFLTLLFASLDKVFTPTSWIQFIICILAFFILGSLIYVLVNYSKDEKKRLVLKIRQLFNWIK